MIGYRKISESEFYLRGGFANTKFVRVTRNKAWAYYEET